VLSLLLSGAAFGLCHVFSGRGAFIHFGAMLGSIMVANVFFVIIPGQRAMVLAKQEGREPDPQAGIRGKLRSVHNTYFTLPVIFTMISNHYALTFGARYNWLVLIVMSAAGALIRVYFVTRHRAHERKEKTPVWPALLGLSLLAATAIALAPRNSASVASAGTPAEQFAAIQRIISARCVPCHASAPTQAGFAAAPKGLLLDSREAILSHLPVIEPQVRTRVMPIGNLTQMSDAERNQLLDWIERGAPR
jgi:uncharacterized membrane protein